MRMETSRPASQVDKLAKTSVKVIWSPIIGHWVFDTVLAKHTVQEFLADEAAIKPAESPVIKGANTKEETVDSEGVRNHVSGAVNKYQVQGIQYFQSGHDAHGVRGGK